MSEGSYFERRFGALRAGRNTSIPEEVVYTPPVIDTGFDPEEARIAAISEVIGEKGATSEEISQSLAFLKEHPDFAQSIRAGMEASLTRAKKLSPEELRATLETEMKVLASESPDSAEVERLRKNGVLVPILITNQAREVTQADSDIRSQAGKSVGRLKRTKKSQRAAMLTGAVAVTGASAYLDFTFAKEGLADVVDVIVDKLGAEQAVQLLGQKWSSVLSMTNGSAPVLNALEQAQYGKGAITMTLVLGALGYLGVRKVNAENVAGLFDFKKHPIHASMTAAFLTGFLGLGAGAVTQKVTESLRARTLAMQIDKKFKPTEEKLRTAIQSVKGLKGQIEPIITSKVDIAFKTGKVRVGPLTASTWLALNGNVPDENGQMIIDRYRSASGSATPAPQTPRPQAKGKKGAPQESVPASPTLTADPMSRFAAIQNAVNSVNRREKYLKLGMKDGDGAKQLLVLLTQSLPGDAERLSEHFNTMLAIAGDKAAVTLKGAILGKINPLDANFWKQAIGMEKLFQMQEQYPEKYIELIRKVLALQVINTYLSDVEGQIKSDASITVDLKIDLLLPSLGFSEQQMKELTIPRSEYKDVLDPRKIDKIVNLFWGTPEAWKARQEIVARDLVDNRMGETSNEWQPFIHKLAYEGSIYGVFFLLVMGSVGISGFARKKLNRWYEADLDEQTQKINEHEDSLIDAVIAYAHALSAESVATLTRNGVDAAALGHTSDAFRSAVSHALRKSVLDKTIDPRTGSKLSESLDAKAFLNREKSRTFEGEERNQILKAYESQLMLWQSELKNNPFGTIENLLKEVDPAFSSTAQALLSVNTSDPGSREQELAVQSLKAAFELREGALMSKEADRAGYHVAKLQARRAAVEQMTNDDDDVDLILDGTDSADIALSQKQVIRSYVLADIDSEIHEWERMLEDLASRGATISSPPSEVTTLSDSEWEQERSGFLAREMSRLGDGSDMTAEGEVTLSKMNEFIQSINRGLGPIKRELEANLQKLNPNSEVNFIYGYSPRHEGPSIRVTLTDKSNATLSPTVIPFLYKIPSEQGSSSQKILADIQEWARPDGVLSQRLRVGAIFEATRSEYRTHLTELESLGTSSQYEIGSVRSAASQFDAFVRSADIMRVQKEMIERLIVGQTLSTDQMRVFTSPQTAIRDVWKGSISTALERAQQRKFGSLDNQRLVVAFDATDKGYIVAIPKDAPLPVSIDSIRDVDKILLKRALVA